MEKGVIVKNITGTVSLCKEGEMINVKSETKLQANSKYQIFTDNKSYALIYNKLTGKQKQDSFFILFPKSMMIINTGTGFISDALILIGLVYATMPPGHKISTHTAEFEGSAIIETLEDGTTTIANTRDTIYNKLKGSQITMDEGEQVVITMQSISKPQPMDQRFKDALEIISKLGNFEAISIYESARLKTQDFKAAYTMAMKELSTQTGYDISNLNESLKAFDLYEKGLEQMHKDSFQTIKEIQQSPLAVSYTTSINTTFDYGGLSCTVESVKIEKKQDNKFKITLFLKISNDSSKQFFIFWNEECRLINYKKEIFELDDYKMETNFDPEKKSEGYLIFIVNGEIKDSIIQFGKKSAPKAEVKIPFTKLE